MTEVGTKAPPFSLPNEDGKTVTLSDFKGQWLILYFYPKDNTPGCTTEACDFTSIHEELNSVNCAVLGVSPDSTESHRKFIDQRELSFSLLSDPEKEVHRAYGAWGIKKNYGKEYEGVIRSTFIINPEGNLAHAWHNVRAKGHANRVQKKLQELLA